jgi:DNA-binding PadR family transcriptional regulator
MNSAEMLKGHLDGLLLAVLDDAPQHGYGVVEQLRQRSGGELDLPSGTVYPALHRLERTGLVRSDWSTHAGRRRRTYRLTAAGRRALQAHREGWQRFTAIVDPILAGPS